MKVKMKGQAGMTQEELVALVKQVPMNAARNTSKLNAFIKERNLSKVEVAHLVKFIAASNPLFAAIDIPPDSTITYGELCEYSERAQVQFIIVHRVNYLLHDAMLAVYDLLEDTKRLRFKVKKCSKQAEGEWANYERPRQRHTEKSAWFTLQDHFAIVCDMLAPYGEKVYTALRDYLIGLGQQDIELLARVELAFLLAKVARHTFVAFFKDFKDACGADFSQCFANDDMLPMVRHFTNMVEELGIKVRRDEYGLCDIACFDAEKSVRVQWAWSSYIKTIRNDDLMDNAALQAINFNPVIKEDYLNVRKEDEREEFDREVEKLNEKFKVTKNKK